MKLEYTIIYTLLCIFLFILIIQWGNYLIVNKYNLYENFLSNVYLSDPNTPLTSHSVDLPINTTYSCQNMCGPQSQCSITREQCTSDVDCQGCQPIAPSVPNYIRDDIVGQNDAGKLVVNINPRYSALTTDIGTQAAFYKHGAKDAKVPMPYEGINLWRPSYDEGMKIFDMKEAYRMSAAPEEYRYMPTYPIRQTVTGLFEDDGPLAANAYL